MAHYAAVASVVQLLHDIIRSNLYSRTDFLPTQRILESLFQKFSSLRNFLKNHSSRSGHAEAARRIREVAYRTQEILLQISNFSNQISCSDELVKLGEQLDSAMEELEKIEPDLQRSSYSCDPTASKLGAVVPVVGLDHYAVVASVVQLLGDMFRSDLYSRTEFLPSQRILESLFQKFSSLLDFMTDYSSKSGHAGTARRIREVAYRTQEILLQKSNISNQISCSDELVKLGEQLDSAVEDLKKIEPDLQRSSYSSDPTASKLGAVPVVGLDHLVTKIADQLCSYSPSLAKELHSAKKDLTKSLPDLLRSCYSRDRTVVGLADLVQKCSDYSWLEVHSIVGMAGIGKTTLARHIFESKSIVDHFDCRGWVTVSQNYNQNKVLQDLLNSFGGVTNRLRKLVYKVSRGRLPYSTVVYKLKRRVRRELGCRRYLIVVDDVWTKEAWYDLLEIFPDNHNGSRIVCTTQCDDVAHNVIRGKPKVHEIPEIPYKVREIPFKVHEMPFLDEENSWILLKHMVNCLPELEFVGRLLATKCGGLPLAIAQLAQILLRNATTPECWEYLAANANSILGAEHGGILFNALSRSYDQLTDQLKACFLYFGSFPDDCEISASKLVKMWDAELIDMISEYEAQDCLEELIQRNLVHLIIKETTTTGRIKFCKLHDLVRSFCRRKACDENFLHATQVQNEQIDITAFDRCKLWRVLDTVDATPWLVLNAAVQMFHLKCLSLHLKCPTPKLSLSPLPSSISMFQKLHTLIIHDPDPFPPLTLPPQIWEMTQLRHVMVTVMTLLPPISMVSYAPVPKLEYLQTLSTVKDFIFTDDVIEMIPNLRKLKISFTGIDSNGWHVFYDHLDNLVHLRKLKELTIMVDPVSVFGFDSIWSNFAFPCYLRKLSIGGCKLPWEEMTMIGSLPELQILKLRRDSFVGPVWVPIVGEFRRLKILSLEMLDFGYWLANHTHFPSLECLKIILCNDLKEIPFSQGLASLRLIEICGGSISIQESAQQIKAEFRKKDLQVVLKNSYS